MDRVSLGIIIGISAVLLLAAFIVVWALLRRNNAQAQRQHVVSRLKAFAKLRGYKVLTDVDIPAAQGKLHVDLALVGYFGVLFLTVLSETGDYYGEENAPSWLYVNKGHKRHFPNPLLAGQAVMDGARRIFAKNDVYNVTMDHWVVFTPSFKGHELAVKESLQTIHARKLGSLLDREAFEKDNGLDLERVASLLAGADQA